jgi:pyruvate,water dikinase
VRRCWAGLFGPQVLTYNPGGQSAALDDLAMCVGVQQMVDARAAGVMFTLDPVTGDRSKIVLEGCWGLGEGVVKGDVTPDRFRVDKVTLELLKREISPKPEEYRFDGEGEVRLMPVDAELVEQPCLDDEHVIELATLAKRIERHRGAPQDIEWAVEQGGAVRVLQVRPETVWAAKAAAKPAVASSTNAVASVLGYMSGGKRP